MQLTRAYSFGCVRDDGLKPSVCLGTEAAAAHKGHSNTAGELNVCETLVLDPLLGSCEQSLLTRVFFHHTRLVT